MPKLPPKLKIQKMRNEPSGELICHLEALRRMLLGVLAVTMILFPAGYYLAPVAVEALVSWCFPANSGNLHYFAPLEVFWVHLKFALVFALAAGYPVNAFFVWKFLLPALYRRERRSLRLGVIFSALLFFAGAAFCVFLVLPLLMRFAAGFASDTLTPMIGIANFVQLSGGLMLAFGIMFQVPLLVLLAVKAGIISTDSLVRKRPFVVTVILIIAAILTPPDVVSQLLLAVPAWLLFECGLLLARRMEK